MQIQCRSNYGAILRKCSKSILALGLTALVVGCTSVQVATVVKYISIYAQEAEPILTALLPIITSLSSGSQDSSAATSLNSFALGAEADLNALTSLCNDYASSPSVSVYRKIEATVDRLVSESDSALLQVLAIKDASTRQRVQVAIAGFDALIHTIDGFVQMTQSSATVAAKAQSRAIKLDQVAGCWSEEDKATVAHAFGYDFSSLLQHATRLGL